MSDTLPKLLSTRAETTPEAPAIREKAFGIWRTFSWQEYRERVATICRGLDAIGVERGDRVAIVGDNRPAWVQTELAAQSLGAIPIGVYQDAVGNELAAVIDAAGARLVVVEDQEQVDKVLDVRDRLPALERVVFTDERGMRHYDDPLLMPLSELVSEGKEHDRFVYADRVQDTRPDDVALLATTSGTTGAPKLAMLTHKNLLSMATNLLAVDPLGPDDELVSFLPLAWVGEQMMSVSSALASGCTVCFPEEPETVTEDLREIAPQAMFAPPRIWESLLSEIQIKYADASWLKRRLLDWSLHRSRSKLSDLLCLYWIRDALGLRRLKRAYTGGAALGPDALAFFHALGVNLKQIYGQTEVSGISVVHRDGDVKPDTMGVPLPETEVRITDDGEIVTRGPAVFAGYYRNEAGTRAALRDAWLYSGDAGYFDDDGHLVVIDRRADVTRLHDGTTFSPQFVENKLKYSAYVREAVVFGGEDRPFVTAMLVVDFENVAAWAEKHQVPFTTFTDLSQQERVRELVTREVERLQEPLPPPMHIRRFLLLYKELDADDAELTRTRKVRRHAVAERYRDLVDALYRDVDHVVVDTEITYRDGRRSRLSLSVPIVTLS